MSASSEFFAKILKENPIANPMVVLPKEVRKDDFGHLLHFMYNGSVDVPKCCLDNVLAAAQILQIKGLTRDRKRKSSPKIKYLNTKRMHYYEEQPALPVDSTDFPTKTIEIILDDNNVNRCVLILLFESCFGFSRMSSLSRIKDLEGEVTVRRTCRWR